MPESKLKNLRKEIDKIDSKLLELLAKRCDVVHQVGLLKGKNQPKKNVMRPGREAEIIRKINDSWRGGLPKAAVILIWRLIIAGSLNIEQKFNILMKNSVSAGEFIQIRDFFGAFASYKKLQSDAKIINDLIKNKQDILALAGHDEVFFNANFSKLLQEKFRIIVKLPFFEDRAVNLSSIYILASVEPEKTDVDKTVFLAATKKSFLEVSSIFKKKLILINQAKSSGKSLYLFEADGFFEKSPNAELKILGCYATPVRINE